MYRILSFVGIGLLALMILSCKTKAPMVVDKVIGKMEKIDFALEDLDADGLIGPTNGKVSIDYEFCYPMGADYEKQLHAIDPDLKLLSESKGRSGCSKTQSLAIGSTHKSNHKEILLRLSELDFVKRIRRVWYE